MMTVDTQIARPMVEYIIVFQSVWRIGSKRQIAPGMRRMTGKTMNGADLIIRTADRTGRQELQETLVVVAPGTVIPATPIGIVDVVAGGVDGIPPLSFCGKEKTVFTMAGETAGGAELIVILLNDDLTFAAETDEQQGRHEGSPK
jgi:hypothetical protein